MWKNWKEGEERDREELDANLSTTQFEDEYDGKKYHFDFNALAKVKRRERLRIFAFLMLVFVLAVALVVMVILYKNKNTVVIQTIGKLSVAQAKLKIYERTAIIGEDCHNKGDGNITKCGENALCRSLYGGYFCDCLIGFVSDGSAHCKDVHFAIDFKTPTVKDIPELHRIHIKKSDALSVCFWFKMNPTSASRWMSAFMFTSVEISGDNDFMVWVTEDQVHIYLRSSGKRVAKTKFPYNEWSHLCWMWKKTGQWWTYVNGKLIKTGYESDEKFKEPFPDSLGNILLGQDKDEDIINQPTQMLHGSMSQFYIYSKLLTRDDVTALYHNKPPANDIVVGWWQFKNITRGENIVESGLPQEILDREL